MGIQINGVNDIISATDGGFSLSGAELTNLSQVNVTGVGTFANLVVSGNVSIAGTLTYEDVTNVDSIGIVTARTGVRIDAGGIVVVGVTTVAAGTTALPSISPTGDSNTGVFFPSADTIAFGEGGAEAARFDSSGRLLLGTSTTRSNLSGGNAALPAYHLVEGALDNGKRTSAFVYGAASNSGPILALAAHASNSVGGVTAVTNGWEVGIIDFQGADGTNFVPAARIAALVDGTPGANDMPGRLVFSTTADGGSSPTERMRIDSAGTTTLTSATSTAPFIAKISSSEKLRIDSGGRLLVGTSTGYGVASSGLARFQVGSTAADIHASLTDWSNLNQGGVLAFGAARGGAVGDYTVVQNGDNLGSIRFAGADGTDLQSQAASILAAVDGTPGSNDMPGRLVFSTTADGASSPTERMRIDSSGRLGIGSATPDKNLVVNQSNPGADVGIRIKNNTTTDAGTTASLRFTTSTSDFDTAALIADRATGSLRHEYGGSERARLTSDGKLLVGTSSAYSQEVFGATGFEPKIQVNGSSGDGISIVGWRNTSNYPGNLWLARSNSDTIGTHALVTDGQKLGEILFSGSDGTDFENAASIKVEVDGTAGANDMPGRLVFSTTTDGSASPTERMRINRSGELAMMCNANNYNLFISNASTAGTTFRLIDGRYGSQTAYSGTTSFIVYTNGNVQNTNNSYGALSDIKLKENVVDANSQWDDLKALQVRNYNLKEGQTHTQIGLVAQEVELVSPGLVSESPDRDEDGNDLGTVTKSVNYSVLYMKAIKALQEAMERIEQLEAKVAALESA
jgi:hypothetical protein